VSNEENDMPTIEPFSDELLTTDMIFGTEKGIDSLIEIYKDKNVHVDNGNKGATFLTSENALSRKKPDNKGYSKDGIARNKDYVQAFSELPTKYVNSIKSEQSITTGKGSYAIRRKCKSILHWQLILKGLRVQFVVSGLDLNAVPNKQIRLPKEIIEYSQKGASSSKDNKDKAITDAELRWVFRNRNVDQVRKGVQFWKSSTGDRYGKPTICEAPWDMPAYQSAWKEYGLSIEKKRSGVTQAREELDGWIMGELGLMG
jgi:hypothetical protein